MSEHDPMPARVVEAWWCPVCGGAAHRTLRPGRPKIYCSNACRQRAYRWRRDHHARTVATPDEPVESALVSFGRFHAMRTQRDFVTHHTDRRRRQPTACGVLAAPTRGNRGKRTHYNFLLFSPNSCRRCVDLVIVPIERRTTVNRLPPVPQPWERWTQRDYEISDQRSTMLTSATKRTPG